MDLLANVFDRDLILGIFIFVKSISVLCIMESVFMEGVCIVCDQMFRHGIVVKRVFFFKVFLEAGIPFVGQQTYAFKTLTFGWRRRRT